MKFKNHILPGRANIFDGIKIDEEIKSKFHLVDKEFETTIWNKLVNKEIVDKYELRADKFEKYTILNFAEDYDLITRLVQTIEQQKKN